MIISTRNSQKQQFLDLACYRQGTPLDKSSVLRLEPVLDSVSSVGSRVEA
jgi:hypothetical protein